MTRRPVKSRRARNAPVPKRKRVARKPQPGKAAPLDDFIIAAARALDLTIARSWMPAVRNHLEVTLRHGALVADFALPDDAEPAPVFEA